MRGLVAGDIDTALASLSIDARAVILPATEAASLGRPDGPVDSRLFADRSLDVDVSGSGDHGVAAQRKALLPNDGQVRSVEVDRTRPAGQEKRPDVGVQACDLGGTQEAFVVEEPREDLGVLAKLRASDEE